MNKNMNPLIIFGVLGTVLIGILIWRFPTILDSDDNVARLIWSLVLLSALLVGIRHHYSLPQILKYGGAWIAIFLVLLIGYSFHEELGMVADRVHSNLMPASVTQHEDGSVSFLRLDDGHFHIEALVNGVSIPFMVDTGATSIALTRADAKRLGFDVENLSYSQPIQTANGTSFSAPIRLAEFKVGSLMMKDVSASVCENMSGSSLLGMSFLKRLKGFTIEGDRLTMR